MGKGFVSEGHTAWDSFLSSASAQASDDSIPLLFPGIAPVLPKTLTDCCNLCKHAACLSSQ